MQSLWSVLTCFQNQVQSRRLLLNENVQTWNVERTLIRSICLDEMEGVNSIVKLNVCGSFHTTYVSTLRCTEGMFEGMFDDQSLFVVAKDNETNSVVLDLDAAHARTFRDCILPWLREFRHHSDIKRSRKTKKPIKTATPKSEWWNIITNYTPDQYDTMIHHINYFCLSKLIADLHTVRAAKLLVVAADHFTSRTKTGFIPPPTPPTHTTNNVVIPKTIDAQGELCICESHCLYYGHESSFTVQVPTTEGFLFGFPRVPLSFGFTSNNLTTDQTIQAVYQCEVQITENSVQVVVLGDKLTRTRKLELDIYGSVLTLMLSWLADHIRIEVQINGDTNIVQLPRWKVPIHVKLRPCKFGIGRQDIIKPI